MLISQIPRAMNLTSLSPSPSTHLTWMNSHSTQVVFDVNCLMHQFHLAVSDGLRLANVVSNADLLGYGSTWSYTSMLATTLHVWRDCARQVYLLLAERNSPAAASARRMPPRFLGGRWGSVTECEQYLLACPDNHKEAGAALAQLLRSRATRTGKASIVLHRVTARPTIPPAQLVSNSSVSLLSLFWGSFVRKKRTDMRFQ